MSTFNTRDVTKHLSNPVPNPALSLAPGKLPDTQSASGAFGVLEWVGMENIAVPLNLELNTALARADIAVDLINPNARGIHMSRLYLLIDEHLSAQQFSPALIEQVLMACLQTHVGLSHRAKMQLRFELLLRRPALASEHSGWRSYPITVQAQADETGQFELKTSVQISYASTCPCSAALARQVLQQRFEADFPTPVVAKQEVLHWLGEARGGSGATPHAQRSTLDVEISLLPNNVVFPWQQLIDALEHSLQTPVQTAVKRIDEQAFATRNGANLMFVEDALRRVRSSLEALPFVDGYRACAKHLESLHAHDAVGMIARPAVANSANA
jgi:GTP cyclohydrolase I